MRPHLLLLKTSDAADYTSLNRIIITHKPFKNIPSQPEPKSGERRTWRNGILWYGISLNGPLNEIAGHFSLFNVRFSVMIYEQYITIVKQRIHLQEKTQGELSPKLDMSHSIKKLWHFMVDILTTMSKSYGSTDNIMRMFVALELPGASCHVNKYSVLWSLQWITQSECREVRHQIAMASHYRTSVNVFYSISFMYDCRLLKNKFGGASLEKRLQPIKRLFTQLTIDKRLVFWFTWKESKYVWNILFKSPCKPLFTKALSAIH